MNENEEMMRREISMIESEEIEFKELRVRLKRVSRLNSVVASLAVLSVGFVFLYTLLAAITSINLTAWVANAIFALFVSVSVGTGSAFAQTYQLTKASRKSLQKLDKRSLSSLCELLQHVPNSVEVREKIIELLSKMTASDAALLTPAARHFLNTSLTSTNREFLFAILKVYEQVGDESVKPYVSFLTFTKRDPELREQAKRTLEMIAQHAENRKLGFTLLRPSSASSDPSTLLRPTESASPESKTVLLRGSSKE